MDVYGTYNTYNELVTEANLNQRSHHWGASLIVPSGELT